MNIIIRLVVGWIYEGILLNVVVQTVVVALGGWFLEPVGRLVLVNLSNFKVPSLLVWLPGAVILPAIGNLVRRALRGRPQRTGSVSMTWTLRRHLVNLPAPSRLPLKGVRHTRAVRTGRGVLLRAVADLRLPRQRRMFPFTASYVRQRTDRLPA